jgi:large subunit ribosomal protein L3
MVNGLWGRKIGMAQVFAENRECTSVTVIDTAHWFVTNVKTDERDGYSAVQVGYARPKYHGQTFDLQWLKKLKNYFEHIYEIRGGVSEDIKIGQPVPFARIIAEGDIIDVAGVTKGRGFAGVMKRHGFSGGPATHGSNLHRRTGSIGFMATQGRVPKGKKMPGHMGVDRCTVKNLKVVSIDPERNIVLVKGAVPGHAGAPVFVRKSR